MGKAKGRTNGLGLGEAPVFYPTLEEFAHPLRYIASIRDKAEQYGMCRIVPPPAWDPPFALNREGFSFKTKLQAIHQLQERPAGCDPETFRLEYRRFLEREGLPILPWPVFLNEELDLCKLFNAVRRRGGHQKVSDDQTWGEVLRMIKPERALALPVSYHNNLRQLYEKYLLVYEKHYVGQLEHGDDKLHVAGRQVDIGKGRKDGKSQRGGGGPERNQTRAHVSSTKDTNDSSRNGSPKPESRYKGGKHLRSGGLPPGSQANAPRVNWGHPTPLQEPAPKRLKVVEAGGQVEKVEMRNDQICEQCKGGEHEHEMLLCDRCNKGWHMYCLSPPLERVPAGNWYCLDCINSEKELFGFGTGQDFTLGGFQRMADRFKRKWFGSEARSKLLAHDDVEAEFWKIVEQSTAPVEVVYGNDLDTSICGSGFPRRSDPCPPGQDRAAWEAYAASPWNLNNLPKHEGSMLRHVDDNIPGVIVPWLYVGMLFSSFCWHFEDHCFYSINYLHWGEPKLWYGVPGFAAEDFERVMKQAFPDLFEAQPDLLFQLVTMLNPSVLKQNGVPVYRTVQEARNFVVTFPRSYHGGFNLGFNCAEAVNFAPPDWLPWGGHGVERYRLYRRSAIISHEELLCACSRAGEHDPETVRWLRKEMTRVVQNEAKLREKLWLEGMVKSTRMAPHAASSFVGQEEDEECIICHYYLHLSAIACDCRPGEVVCLEHARRLCECQPSKRRLLYRHSLAELEDLVSPRAFSEDNSPTVCDAETLPGGPAAAATAVASGPASSGSNGNPLPGTGAAIKGAGVESESPAVAAPLLTFQRGAILSLVPSNTSLRLAMAGMRHGLASVTRKKRVKGGREASHAELAMQWITRTRVALRTLPTLAVLEELMEEAEEFLWGGPEMDLVRDVEARMRKARDWARDVAACCQMAASCRASVAAAPAGVAQAATADVALRAPAAAASGSPGSLLAGVSRSIGAQRSAQPMLDVGPLRLPDGATKPAQITRPSLGVVQELVAVEPVPCVEPHLKELKGLVSEAEALEAQISDVLSQQSPLPELKELVSVYERAAKAPIEVPSLLPLRDAIAQTQAWAESVRKALPPSKLMRSRRVHSELPSLAHLRSLLSQGEKLPVRVPEQEQVAAAVEKAETWSRAAQLLLASTPTLQAVEAALEEAEGVAAQTAEAGALRERCKRAKDFVARAQAAFVPPPRLPLHQHATWHTNNVTVLQALVSEGAGLRVEVPELAWLKDTIRNTCWRDRAHLALTKGAQLRELSWLIDHAARYQMVNETMSQLAALRDAAAGWEAEAEQALRLGAPIDRLLVLTRSAEAIRADLFGLRAVKTALLAARQWLARAPPLLGKLPKASSASSAVVVKQRSSRPASQRVPVSLLQQLARESRHLVAQLPEVEALHLLLRKIATWKADATRLLALPPVSLPGSLPDVCRGSLPPKEVSTSQPDSCRPLASARVEVRSSASPEHATREAAAVGGGSDASGHAGCGADASGPRKASPTAARTQALPHYSRRKLPDGRHTEAGPPQAGATASQGQETPAPSAHLQLPLPPGAHHAAPAANAAAEAHAVPPAQEAPGTAAAEEEVCDESRSQEAYARWQEAKRLVKAGLKTGVELPQIADLHAVVKACKGDFLFASLLLDPSAPLSALDEMLRNAESGACVFRASHLAAIRQTAERSREWARRAAALGGQAAAAGGPQQLGLCTPEQIQELLTRAESLRAVPEAEVARLQGMLASHRSWEEQVQAVLTGAFTTCRAELERLKVAGEAAPVASKELPRLQAAMQSLSAWSQRCQSVLAREGCHVSSAPEHVLLDLLLKIKGSLEGGLAQISEDGAACHRRVCACQVPFEESATSQMVRCESCNDWFHPACVGHAHAPKPGAPGYTCPFCAALSSGHAPLPGEAYAKMRATRRPSLSTLLELSALATSTPCRVEETDVLGQVVQLAQMWDAKLHALLAPALTLRRGASPLTGPTLVRVLKAGGAVEVDEGGLLRAAVAAHSWRIRACQLLIDSSKPALELLQHVVHQGATVVSSEDGVLQELQQREAAASAWLTRALHVAFDDGAAPVEEVRQLIKAGEALPWNFDNELKELRERATLYCVCRKPYNESRAMIACDRCGEWYHYSCIHLPEPCSPSRGTGGEDLTFASSHADGWGRGGGERLESSPPPKRSTQQQQQQQRKRSLKDLEAQHSMAAAAGGGGGKKSRRQQMRRTGKEKGGGAKGAAAKGDVDRCPSDGARGSRCGAPGEEGTGAAAAGGGGKEETLRVTRSMDRRGAGRQAASANSDADCHGAQLCEEGGSSGGEQLAREGEKEDGVNRRQAEGQAVGGGLDEDWGGQEKKAEEEFVCPQCQAALLERERQKAEALQQRAAALQQRVEQLVQQQSRKEQQRRQHLELQAKLQEELGRRREKRMVKGEGEGEGEDVGCEGAASSCPPVLQQRREVISGHPPGLGKTPPGGFEDAAAPPQRKRLLFKQDNSLESNAANASRPAAGAGGGGAGDKASPSPPDWRRFAASAKGRRSARAHQPLPCGGLGSRLAAAEAGARASAVQAPVAAGEASAEGSQQLQKKKKKLSSTSPGHSGGSHDGLSSHSSPPTAPLGGAEGQLALCCVKAGGDLQQQEGAGAREVGQLEIGRQVGVEVGEVEDVQVASSGDSKGVPSSGRPCRQTAGRHSGYDGFILLSRSR